MGSTELVDRYVAREIERQLVGDDFNTCGPDFIRAFAEGALEPWDEVKVRVVPRDCQRYGTCPRQYKWWNVRR
jgi:hypothetical protein